VEVGEGDQVGFVVGGDPVDGVADLLDIDGSGERSLLCIVAF
jgi:hypothetical protein